MVAEAAASIAASAATRCTDAGQAWAFAAAATTIAGDRQPFAAGWGLLAWAWAFKGRPWLEASVSQIVATLVGFAFFTGFITTEVATTVTAIKNWAVPAFFSV